MRPLIVLPELTFGNNFFPPIILPPKYENVSNSQIITIILINNILSIGAVI